MNKSGSLTDDPDFLLEAARILNAVLETRVGVPGTGFDQAASILKSTADVNASDAKLRLFLLRALALGQQYREMKRSGKPVKDVAQLREHIKADLQFVFKRR